MVPDPQETPEGGGTLKKHLVLMGRQGDHRTQAPSNGGKKTASKSKICTREGFFPKCESKNTWPLESGARGFQTQQCPP